MDAASLLTVAVTALTAAAPVGVTTEELYGHRLLLGAAGQPEVALGITSGREEIALSATGGLRAVGRPAADAGWIAVDLGPAATAQRLAGREAELSYAVTLATLEGADRSRREEVLASWRARGAARVFSRSSGLIFGILGTVVDNRATLILTGTTSSLSRCEQTARELNVRHGITTRVESQVRRLPELRLRFEGADASAIFVGTVLLTDRAGGAVNVHGVEAEAGKQRSGGFTRGYLGAVALAPDQTGRVAVVNIIAVDEVLKGVVPSEMYATASLEALKAQAVTARGAVFAKLSRRHFADPFTLCNKQHCQVYRGTGAYHPNTSRAIDETRGELAFLAGELVDSVYSSTCGGHTENAEIPWDTPPKAALRGRRDGPGAAAELARRIRPFEHGGLGAVDAVDSSNLSDESALRAYLARPAETYCARASVVRRDKLRWSRRFTTREMDRLLFPLGVGHVRGFEVLGRGVSGRLRALRIVGDRKTVVIQREWPVRKAIGKLNSGAFVIDVERTASGDVAAFNFTGMGWGHGVGMCQVGAIGMAEAGHDYREILSHYYNGAQVRRVY